MWDKRLVIKLGSSLIVLKTSFAKANKFSNQMLGKTSRVYIL